MENVQASESAEAITETKADESVDLDFEGPNHEPGILTQGTEGSASQTIPRPCPMGPSGRATRGMGDKSPSQGR